MNLKFCSCGMCKRGRKCKFMQSMINNRKGGYRRKTKTLLKQGKYDKIEDKIMIGYTD